MKVTKNISIEDLVDSVEGSVKYLMEKGIKCIACGEPIWGTLESAAKEKNFTDSDIEEFVKDLNKLLENPAKKNSPTKHIDTKPLN